MRSMEPGQNGQPYADEDYPGELLVCRRPPCHGQLYHDEAWHEWMSHGGPPPPGASTTPFDPDPRYVAPDEGRAEDEAFASARAVAVVLIVLLLVVFVATIVLVSGRPPR